MTRSKLTLAADERTDDLLRSILDEIDDHTLDQLDVQREISKQSGLTAEPATVVATIVAATPILLSVLRILKAYLDGRQVIKRVELVLQAYERGNPEAAKLVAEIARSAPPGWSVQLGDLKVETRHSD